MFALYTTEQSGLTRGGIQELRALVVEDDPDLNRQLRQALVDAGFAVDTAHDGEDGFFLGDTEPYDIVILDIGLPKMDGISILEQWRRAGRNMPVIILTARDRWSDKVAGIDAGADDYLAKPFHMEELLARVRAQVRRFAGHAKSEIECGPLRLDTRTARVTCNGQPIADIARIPATCLSHASQRAGRLADRLVEHLTIRTLIAIAHDRGLYWPASEENSGRYDRPFAV